MQRGTFTIFCEFLLSAKQIFACDDPIFQLNNMISRGSQALGPAQTTAFSESVLDVSHLLPFFLLR